MENKFKDCIEACHECAGACKACAIACLQEPDIAQLAQCVQLDMACATICHSAAQLMQLNSNYAEDICRICAEICEECGNECGKHAHMEHCRRCAEVCHSCAEACRKMVGIAA